MAKNPLLPLRHVEKDFFIADIFDSLPVKDDRHTMEHPFFTLSTKKDTKSISYEHNGVRIKLSPSAEFGLPTMMDKDILLYCGSQLMGEVNKGVMPSKTIRFSAHDLMYTTNRETNGKGYKLLKNAFERLTGCIVTTDIETNGKKHTKGFHLLESYEVVENSRDKKRMVRVEVTISDWFYNSIIAGEVLTINRDYFRLRKTLERRLYELGRKFCGRQLEWAVSLENLKIKSGSRSDLNYFRFQIRNIIKSDKEGNHFPDYTISLSDKDIVTFNRKNPQLVLGFDDLPALKSETIKKGKRITEDAGTGWDYGVIREQFAEALIRGFKPEKVDGAFINFVKKKVQTQP